MDNEAIRDELEKVRLEIRELKREFSKKRDEKESHFSKGKDFSKEIDALYDEVKKIEEESGLDKINEELESKKKECEVLKGRIDELESKFTQLRASSKKGEGGSFSKKRATIGKLKNELARLDMKLQVQVLSLKEESELIDKIKSLKREISEIVGVKTEGGEDEFGNVKTQLKSVRRDFIEAERSIRSLYKKIRLISKEKKKRYKRIDEIKDEKKKTMDLFREHKKEYSKLGKKLKALFKKEEELMEKLGESPVNKKKEFDKIFKAKRREVEDKLMKKKGVLTTEDLLMFQRK